MIRNLSIRKKLNLSFFTMTAFLAIVIIIGLINTNETNRSLEHINVEEEVMAAYNDIAFHVVRANAAVRGYMLYQDDLMRDNHYEIRKQAHAAIEKVKELDGESSDFKEFENNFLAWEEAIDKEVFSLIDNGQIAEAAAVSKPILGEGSRTLVLFSKEMANKKNAEIISLTDKIEKNGDKNFLIMLVVGLIAAVVSVSIALVFGRRITKAIDDIVKNITEFASGNLTINIKSNRSDELGQLAKAINAMADHLKGMLKGIANSSDRVAATSEELTASSEEVSKANEQISESIQEISTGIEKQNERTKDSGEHVDHISNEMQHINENIKNVNQVVSDTTTVAGNGREIVAKVVNQMDVILAKTDSITEALHSLNDKSTNIGKMVVLISDIAEQTNLLALNASIEAARAGEHGKGFAVVANEVRKLAEQSAGAAQQIRALTDEITSETSSIVKAMDDNNESVHNGKTYADQTDDSFEHIHQAVAQVHEQTLSVTQVIEKINEDIQYLVHDFKDMLEVSENSVDHVQSVAASTEQENAAMQEIAAAAHELSKMSVELREAVHVFKV
ncbi:methyl-accepting chemotaxis protein [Bacillus tianshenii]|nr:methyl-accepting chemotaxis protein [Bacillus tianshenii]